MIDLGRSMTYKYHNPTNHFVFRCASRLHDHNHSSVHNLPTHYLLITLSLVLGRDESLFVLRMDGSETVFSRFDDEPVVMNVRYFFDTTRL